MEPADLGKLRLQHSITDAQRRQSVAQRESLAQQLQRLGRVAGQMHQRQIDRELRATRRDLLCEARRRAGGAVSALFDAEFLSVADDTAITRGILSAAVYSAAADSCDLQLHDQGALLMHAQHGFSETFLSTFGVVKSGDPTPCAAALDTRKPVLIEDVTNSSIINDHFTLEHLIDAGSRAIESYPLHDAAGTEVLGVLSFHYRKPQLGIGNSLLVAQAAANALRYTCGPAGPNEIS